MADYVTLPESRVPIVARPDVLVERFSYTGGLATSGMIILL